VIPLGNRMNSSQSISILYSPDRNEAAAMELEFYVQNVKCGGCVNAIQTGLRADPRVQDVAVDIPGGRVVVTSAADIRPELRAQLRTLGYPEQAAG